MKVNMNRCFWKLAEWRDLKNKGLAGGRRPLERNRTQQQCPSQQGNIWMGTIISQPHRCWGLKDESSLQSKLSVMGTIRVTYMCICSFYHVVSHESYKNQNQTKIHSIKVHFQVRLSLLGAGGEGVGRGRRLKVALFEERAVVDVGKQVFVKIIITQKSKLHINVSGFFTIRSDLKNIELGELMLTATHDAAAYKYVEQTYKDKQTLFLKGETMFSRKYSGKETLIDRTVWAQEESLQQQLQWGVRYYIFSKKFKIKINNPFIQGSWTSELDTVSFLFMFWGKYLIFCKFASPRQPRAVLVHARHRADSPFSPRRAKRRGGILAKLQVQILSFLTGNSFHHYLQGTWWCSTFTPSRRSGIRRLTPGCSPFWTVPWVGGGWIQRTDGVRPWKGCGEDKGCRRGRGGSWQCTR